jgi:hypothetical protein
MVVAVIRGHGACGVTHCGMTRGERLTPSLAPILLRPPWWILCWRAATFVTVTSSSSSVIIPSAAAADSMTATFPWLDLLKLHVHGLLFGVVMVQLKMSAQAGPIRVVCRVLTIRTAPSRTHVDLTDVPLEQIFRVVGFPALVAFVRSLHRRLDLFRWTKDRTLLKVF